MESAHDTLTESFLRKISKQEFCRKFCRKIFLWLTHNGISILKPKASQS